MGSICSKRKSSEQHVADNERQKVPEAKVKAEVVGPSVREEIIVDIDRGGQSLSRKASHPNGGSVRGESAEHGVSVKNGSQHANAGSVKNGSQHANAGSVKGANDAEDSKTRIIERPKNGHQRCATLDIGLNADSVTMSRIVCSVPGTSSDKSAAGWPLWLSSVAGDAIQGLVPRSAESFEKLSKIGQGTYSTVYKARDLQNGKIVAMKKVRFVNMDPESVRFMAREISILRRLDHPNVMKLNCLVTSRISGSLYLVFEYMQHDLAGLAGSPGIKFTEQQIKCYMQQIFSGLQHCHSRGVLHRDIKGSNLLIDDRGVMKIGDFGLATPFQPDQLQPLTSRVVTLWYRAPELLLGATEYGVAIDMWSAGCILAELFAGKPIMPGRTEVEQMHKIFKLCGSPSEEYWRRRKLPHATSFKPQHPYKRCIAETYKDFPSSALALLDVLLAVEPQMRGTAESALNSEFFTTDPLPCDPSSLPKYPPSKEFDAKLRDETRRRKANAAEGVGNESRSNMQGSKVKSTPDQHGQSNKSISVKYNPHEESGTGFPIEPPRVPAKGYNHSSSMIHPSAAGYSWTKKVKEEAGQAAPGRGYSSSQHSGVSGIQSSHMRRTTVETTRHRPKKEEHLYTTDSMGFVSKRNRILCSGPLMPPGGNMEDMLKEHERQISDAVRKARLDKARTNRDCYA